jgi:hypothetical protein
MCNATRIKLDAPVFTERYVSFPLMETHGILADFFIRPQGVGLTCKGDDLLLFYLLQNRIHKKKIEFQVLNQTHKVRLEPCLSGEGKSSIDNPLKFYLGTIASGNLKDRSDIVISRDPATFEARADFLSNLLFTQWIAKMYDVILMYKVFKENKLLRDLNSNYNINTPHKDDGGLQN